MIPSYRLCLTTFLVALLFLILWSRSYDITTFSGQKYEHLSPTRTPSKGPNAPPILAYWILGSRGENKRILRLLRAIYHPRNQYLLQLDSTSPEYERFELALSINSQRVFQEFGNVYAVGQSYPVNQRGASGLAAVLHAAALLLRISPDWDWFVPLGSRDYPLWTQDDILFAFGSLPRDLNFVGYSNDTVWEERHNISQIAVDPNLYLTQKTPVFYAEETRDIPDTFQIFGGSPWMILSRNFSNHCVSGWDNLPRKLLMYFNNVVSPLESYFQTILCNTPRFHNTTINDNLRHIVPKTNKDSRIPRNRAIFAGPFGKDDSRELQEIDKRLLKRDPNRIAPGRWCTKTGLVNKASLNSSTDEYFCSSFGDIDVVEKRDEGVKLQKILSRIVEERRSIASLCRSHVVVENE